MPSTTMSDGFGALSKRVPGRAFRPGDREYADRTRGFNLALQHRPDVVVAAESAEQVAAAVQFAADSNSTIAVQCTGHGAGRVGRGSVLIDTGDMRKVSIDPRRRTATVQAGARWSDVFAAATAHGLGGLCGSSSDVGVVGYTLGGGLPVLGRVYGYASDHVRSMEIVTADGRAMTVSDEAEPELFWALRGGAAGSAAVTSMTFGLMEVQQIYGGSLFFDGNAADHVLREYAAWASTVPDELCSSLAFLRLPPAPEIPEPLRGTFRLHPRIACTSSAEAAETLIAPMRMCAPVLLDTLGVMPYSDLDSIHMDPRDPVPFREAGVLVDHLTPQVQRLLLDQAGPGADCPFLLVEVRHLGGALRGERHGSVGHPDAGWHLLAIEVPHAPGAPLTDASEQFRAVLAPLATGYFANLCGDWGDPQVARGRWTPRVYSRLQAVRQAYDPGRLFEVGR